MVKVPNIPNQLHNPVPAVTQLILITSVVGVGAETVGRLLASDRIPWFRGDSWGDRPSGNEEEWTYVNSNFELPRKKSILTMTDGSDVAPWRYFKKRHPEGVIVRLTCSPEELLNRRNEWRKLNDLPPQKSLSPRAYKQLSTNSDVDYLFQWPDYRKDPAIARETISAIYSLYVAKPMMGKSIRQSDKPLL